LSALLKASVLSDADEKLARLSVDWKNDLRCLRPGTKRKSRSRLGRSSNSDKSKATWWTPPPNACIRPSNHVSRRGTARRAGKPALIDFVSSRVVMAEGSRKKWFKLTCGLGLSCSASPSRPFLNNVGEAVGQHLCTW
jgi:hypothetical protein